MSCEKMSEFIFCFFPNLATLFKGLEETKMYIITLYMYKVFKEKNKNKLLLKMFQLLPLLIHYYQQVIFLL